MACATELSIESCNYCSIIFNDDLEKWIMFSQSLMENSIRCEKPFNAGEHKHIVNIIYAHLVTMLVQYS